VTATHLPAGTELAWRDTLDRLALLETGRPVVLTLYLRLEANDRIRNRFRLAAKETVRRLVASSDFTGRPEAERAVVERDLARITAHLDVVSGLPHTPGLALFACEELGLFEVVPLPRVLETRLLTWNRPRTAEARAVLESFSRILVAAVDRSHARFFEVTAFDATELNCLVLAATRGGKFHSDRADAPGAGEHDFHNRIKEERHRHAAAVTRHLGRLAAEAPCQGVVLAGPLRTTRELTRFLPRNLAAMVLGIAPLNPTAVSLSDIREAALTLRSERLRDLEGKLLAELVDGLGTGWAVRGLRPTLRALSHGQVRTLIVPAGQTLGGFRFPASGRLGLTAGDFPSEGPAVPVADLIGETLEEALEQGAEVAILENPRIATQVDRMAALLRFR
jgi:peptide subunit release factor 1 (eRF1)